MELNQFISGERIQKLAEISIIPVGDGNGESNCGFVIDQQKNNNYEAFYYNGNTRELPGEVITAKTLFVNTWTLNKFFNYIFPYLKHSNVFISHNSDLGIGEEHRKYLDSDTVKAWYCQNATISHPKLHALPIGLGNQQYPHGNMQLLNDVINDTEPKSFLFFKNFNIGTNISKRSQIDDITTKNNILMTTNLPQKEYFKAIKRSAFCISPPGNGVDCHRIWESLYLGTIPVVETHSAFNQFKHLPILFIDDWNKVTIDFLASQVGMLNQFNNPIHELTMSYWVQKIYGQNI